jgi:hypothetical protein
LAHFPSRPEFLSLTSSSMGKLIWGLTDRNMRLFPCHFTRSSPAWKPLIRKILRRVRVLRWSRILEHPIFSWDVHVWITHLCSVSRFYILASPRSCDNP